MDVDNDKRIQKIEEQLNDLNNQRSELLNELRQLKSAYKRNYQDLLNEGPSIRKSNGGAITSNKSFTKEELKEAQRLLTFVLDNSGLEAGNPERYCTKVEYKELLRQGAEISKKLGLSSY